MVKLLAIIIVCRFQWTRRFTDTGRCYIARSCNAARSYCCYIRQT